MVVGVQPNWRHIFLIVCLFIVIWYVFFSNDDQVALVNRNNLELQKKQVSKVQVEVYYEVWCPDSRRFVLDQALPAWKKLDKYIDIHWKPYGKAKHVKNDDEVSGYKFECQHGPSECTGNMIQACAIQYVKDDQVLNELIGCMMADNMDVLGSAEKCANSHKVDWLSIKACSESKEGGELLAMYGDDTNSLKPSVHFIPTVQLNGSQDEQKLILKNLPLAICQHLSKTSLTIKECDNLH